MERVKLFVLPFAGGNRYSFSKMKKLLPAHIEYLPVDYPGRASRMNEELLLDIQELVDDIYNAIQPSASSRYMIFGHCIGALLAFLVCRKAAQKGDPLPAHLFVSGCRPPAQLQQAPSIDLSGTGLRRRMLQLGISAELIDHEDFYAMLAPVMKADLTAFAGYQYEKKTPLLIPFTVIMEKESRFTETEAMMWEEESVLPVLVSRLRNYLDHSYKELVEIITTSMQPVQADGESTIDEKESYG